MRLSPKTFWAMSLPEWRAATNGFSGANVRRATPLARAGLAVLMQRFPDASASSG